MKKARLDHSDELPVLEIRHYEWMFSHVQEHFVDEIARLELEQIRHQQNMDVVLYDKTIGQRCGSSVSLADVRVSRQEKITRNDESLAQYRKIVEFCVKVRTRVMNVSAEQAARQFRDLFPGKKASKPQKRAPS